MAVVRKKQDDKFLKVLRELVTTGAGNRQCFDCGQKGPTYVNMTIGSFVCTRCSGVLRGLTPPHRVKSISMATFTQEEIDFLRAHGNDLCAKTWLGLWDPKRAVHQDHRELMIDKYERKRYYLEPASPLKSLTNAASLKNGSNISSSGSSSSSSNSNSVNNNNNSNKKASSTTTAHVLHQQQLKNGYGNHMTNGNGTTTNSSCSSTSSSSSSNNNNINNKCSAINVNSSNKVQAGGGFDSSFQNITLTPPTSQRTTQSGLHKSSSTAISRPQNGYHHQSQSRAADRPGDSSYNAVKNGFGADADFVADFGSANIFDATAAISLGSAAGSAAVTAAASAASSNGYAKILPMKATQIMNGVAGGGNHSAVATLMMNGNIRNQQNGTNGHIINSNNSNNNNNGSSSNNNNNTKSTSENFADFDHAPIFNAAGLPMTNGYSNKQHAASAKSATTANNMSNNQNNNRNQTPAADRYAALKDLDEQLRESKAVAAAAAAVVGTTNAPDAFGNNNNNVGTNVNPFKLQQQHAAMANPFQATQQQQQNLFGQMSTVTNGNILTNGFQQPISAQQQQQQQAQQQQHTTFYNYSSGYTAAGAAASTMFPPPAPSGGPNGCGFGFGSMQQQIAAAAGGGGGGAFNNPFAATGGAVNSNNPFL